MARRKRQFLDDEDSDSSSASDVDEPHFDDNDPDARAERELCENPYQRKRRRKNGKEDAIYGVFGSDDDEEDPSTDDISRDTTLLLIRLCYAQAQTQLSNLDQEFHLLRSAPPMMSHSPRPEDDNRRGKRKENANEGDSWKIDPPVNSSKTNGPILDSAGKVCTCPLVEFW